MGETGWTVPVTQIFSGHCLECTWIHRECVDNMHFSLSLTIRLESTLKDSQRRWNRLVSENTLEGYDS